MDHVAGRGEGTTHGFSAVDLLEVVDNGFTAPGVATFATEFHERKFCVCVLFAKGVPIYCPFVLLYFHKKIYKILKLKSVEHFTTQPQHNS